MSIVKHTDTERDEHIRSARIYLREAQARRHLKNQRGFCFVLLSWEARNRLAALHLGTTSAQAAQGVLF